MRLPFAQQRSGTVLVVVLVLVLLLGLAAYAFVLSMETEHLAIRANGDRLQAQQAAFSMRDWLLATLSQPRREHWETLQELSQLGNSGWTPLQEEHDLLATSTSGMILAPHSGSDVLSDIPREAMDESTRLHLAKLLEWDQLQPGSARQALERLPGLDAAMADRILDWVDPDSTPRLQGAEADAYVEVGLTPRNGLPPSLSELLIPVRALGFSRQSSLEPSLSLSANHTPESPAWLRYLTVCSAERNESSWGNPRIFVNSSSLIQLHQQLSERLPQGWANYIVLYRQSTSSSSQADQSIPPEQVTLDFNQPASRTIESLLDLVDATVMVAGADGSVAVASPFSSEPQQLQTQLPQLFDEVTTEFEQTLPGRVNVNLSTREVLLSVPGIDAGLVERILAARSMGATQNGSRMHPVWLFSEGLVGLEQMKSLLPHLSAGGHVFRAEFWGIVSGQSAAYRCEAIVDAARRHPRQIFFQELPPLSQNDSPAANMAGSGERSPP